MKPLESVLFDIAAGANHLLAFQTTHPTALAQATQEDLARVLEGAPVPHLTDKDINELAKRYDRLDPDDRMEGKVRRPRVNIHD